MILRQVRDIDRHVLEEALAASAAFSAVETRVAMEILDTAISGGLEGDYPTFVAEISGVARGYACVGKTPLTVSTWHLYWLCVHPAFQRRGAGRSLLVRAEDFIRGIGGQRLVIETSGRPDYARVRRFYEQAGYSFVATIPDFYKPDDDLVIYHKPLVSAFGPRH